MCSNLRLILFILKYEQSNTQPEKKEKDTYQRLLSIDKHTLEGQCSTVTLQVQSIIVGSSWGCSHPSPHQKQPAKSKKDQNQLSQNSVTWLNPCNNHGSACWRERLLILTGDPHVQTSEHCSLLSLVPTTETAAMQPAFLEQLAGARGDSGELWHTKK